MDYGIIDEFQKKYENYFSTYDQKQLQIRVDMLEKQLEESQEKKEEYYQALYEIRCIIDIIRRGRIPGIRKVLDQAKIKLNYPPKE